MAGNRSSLYHGDHTARQLVHLELALDNEVCTLLPYVIFTLTTITQSCVKSLLKLATSDFSADREGWLCWGKVGT